MGQLDQTVRFSAHSRKDHDYTVSFLTGTSNSIGDAMDPLDRSDGSPAVFLNDERHRLYPFAKSRLMNLVASLGGRLVACASGSVKRRLDDNAPFRPPSPKA